MADVLVIDSDPALRDLLAGLLRADDHRVVGVAGGAQAYAEIESGFHPHLLVTELALADMSGRDVIHTLRRRAGLERLPVIIISGLDPVSDVRELVAMDYVGFLAKPFDLLALRRVLNDLLAKRSQETRARFASPVRPTGGIGA